MIIHILQFSAKQPTKQRIAVSDEDYFLLKVENENPDEACVLDLDGSEPVVQVDGDEHSTTYKFTPDIAKDYDFKVRLGDSSTLQDLTVTRQDLDIGHTDTASAADVSKQLEAVDEEIAEVKKEIAKAWTQGGDYTSNSGSSIGDSKGNKAIDLDSATYYANSQGKMTVNGLYLTVNPDVTFTDVVHIKSGDATFSNINALGGNLNNIVSLTVDEVQVYKSFNTDSGITAEGAIKGLSLAATQDLNVGRTANMAGNCNVFGDLAVASGKTITIGSTSISEDQLKKLLATLS